MASSDITPEEQALLDAIAAGEGGSGWNTIYGGKKFSDYSGHPREYVTIKSGPNKGQKSSAAGKYQITASTYDQVAPKLGIKDFSPESQQRIALYLARQKYGPNLQADLEAGKVGQVAKKLSGIWTSLPGGIEATTSSKKVANAYSANLGQPQNSALSAINSIIAPNPQSRPASLSAYAPEPTRSNAIQAISVAPNGLPVATNQNLADVLRSRYASVTPSTDAASLYGTIGNSLGIVPAPAPLVPTRSDELITRKVPIYSVDSTGNPIVGQSAVKPSTAASNPITVADAAKSIVPTTKIRVVPNSPVVPQTQPSLQDINQRNIDRITGNQSNMDSGNAGAMAIAAQAARNIPIFGPIIGGFQSVGDMISNRANAAPVTPAPKPSSSGNTLLFGDQADSDPYSGLHNVQSALGLNSQPSSVAAYSQTSPITARPSALANVGQSDVGLSPTYKTIQVLNPDYTKWQAINPVAVNKLQDIHDFNDDSFNRNAVSAPSAAPPKYITQKVPTVPIPKPYSPTPTPASPNPLYAGGILANSLPGHVAQAATGQRPSGGLLGMLFSGQSPVANGLPFAHPAYAAVPTPAPAATPFNYDQFLHDTYGVVGGGPSGGGAWAVGKF